MSPPPILDVLSKYPQVPEAQKALTGLNSLATNPIPLFRNEFTQTDASIADIASQVKDQKDKVTLAKRRCPGSWSCSVWSWASGVWSSSSSGAGVLEAPSWRTQAARWRRRKSIVRCHARSAAAASNAVVDRLEDQ